MITTVAARSEPVPTGDEPVAVHVDDLGKRYRRLRGPRGGVWALRHCGFTLPPGRVAALVGANGAGKTTLLSVLAGVLAPDEGAVAIDPNRGTGRETAGRVAFVAQEKPLYPRFSVADTLRLGAHLNRLWDQHTALRWLDRFDIPLKEPCGRLSGGQQAQVSLAVALGSRPSVLLLDEPLSNLDPLARREATGELLAAANDTGMTVVLSTHVVTELVGVADHLLLLANGRLLVDGDVDGLLARHVRYLGPRADAPPGPGDVVHATHTARQSTFLVRKPDDAAVSPVREPWLAAPVTLEQFVLAHLAASGTRRSDDQ
ncbi:MAG TPA: ABC transporter ATP-binding protein [Pseudonocardiaceae bacterium]|jgi:ABC-2 type transport system ATP-binding protein|nr:ABC transporter ATP-binding protein [Pseudonocardiaceae bacterium]